MSERVVSWLFHACAAISAAAAAAVAVADSLCDRAEKVERRVLAERLLRRSMKRDRSIWILTVKRLAEQIAARIAVLHHRFGVILIAQSPHEFALRIELLHILQIWRNKQHFTELRRHSIELECFAGCEFREEMILNVKIVALHVCSIHLLERLLNNRRKA